jgi:hypothetical protein
MKVTIVEILVCTEGSSNLYGIANRLVDEGHKVRLYTSTKLPEQFGRFEKVTHPHNAIKSSKFIVMDQSHNSSIYDWAKQYNRPIVGSSPMTDMMNIDCYKEFIVGQKLGVSLPETEVLDDVSSMYAKVLDWNPTRTLVRHDRNTITCDHQEWLAWAVTQLPLNKKILLQTPEFGEYVTVMGWFDGNKWVRPFMIKSEGEGKLNSVLLWGADKEWMSTTIEPWGNFLKSIDYHGPFSVRCIASKKGVFVTDTYAGFQFPSMYAFIEGLMEPLAEFLNRVALGVCDGQKFTKDYCSAMLVRSGMKDSIGIPILGLDEGNQKHTFDGCVVESTEGKLIGPGGWTYAATAHGRNPDESFGRMEFTAKVVKIPEPIWTTGMSSVYKPWMTKLGSLELI